MTSVWIVEGLVAYEGAEVLGVFRNETKAKAFKSEARKRASHEATRAPFATPMVDYAYSDHWDDMSITEHKVL